MPFGKRGESKSRLFEAMYGSECEHCGWSIEPGDKAGYKDDEFVCEECWNQ
jgi:hypothetical protein